MRPSMPRESSEGTAFAARLSDAQVLQTDGTRPAFNQGGHREVLLDSGSRLGVTSVTVQFLVLDSGSHLGVTSVTVHFLVLAGFEGISYQQERIQRRDNSSCPKVHNTTLG
eukprot:CAMPEP_0183393676 /NCGR_PEP_ID=MMETSP0370-20130417/8080_1 /TAXON_ID=268820 /ORGANISM="Peridinium aciculiferum, Strain PAER-2" /LENGTH=110 /DNA_ID=CAMNT_0025573927 /DNA_START=324 /DNA_END=657 /DNA_ORIENTATION=-